MTYFYLKGAAFGFFLLLGTILLIHAQPNRDLELRALFTPENCQMPCLLGIRPGATTYDQLIEILHSSSWVGEIDDRSSGGVGNVSWLWSGLQPDWFSKTTSPSVRLAQHITIPYSIPVVAGMDIPTRIPFGQLHLMFGQPRATFLESYTVANAIHVSHKAYYDGFDFWVWNVDLACPFGSFSLESAETRIVVGNDFTYDPFLLTYVGENQNYNLLTSIQAKLC